MRIDINQQKISIGEKYNIFIAEQPTYTAASKIFRWLSEINLFGQGGGLPLLTIKKRLSFIVLKYDIIRDNRIFSFRVKKFWRRHYQCMAGTDLYDIYGHRSRKFSIYKNDRQVAWWEQDSVAWFQGDNYKMLADKDSDQELLIAFCLVIDDSNSKNSKGETVTVHLGYIGPEAKSFDPSWTPRS
jgi:uncharacterized protein YxjI